MKTMDELFHALLQDVYYAEKQLTKALPKMAKEADNAKLKKAFTDHLKETEGHVERLERAFEMISKPVTRLEILSHEGCTPIRNIAWAISSPPFRSVAEPQRSMTMVFGQSP